jgi:regulatory protein
VPTLTAIERTPPRTRRCLLFLDGNEWRATSLDVVRALDLTVGATVREAELDRVMRDAAPGAARARAIRLLKHSDRSAKALADRLVRDGYARDLAEATVAQLGEYSFVDDERLAERLVRTFAGSRLYGDRRVFAELRRRGIPDELASDALARADIPSEDDRALIAARRSSAAPGDLERLVARLARRGFSWEVARRAARRVAGEDRDSRA